MGLWQKNRITWKYFFAFGFGECFLDLWDKSSLEYLAQLFWWSLNIPINVATLTFLYSNVHQMRLVFGWPFMKCCTRLSMTFEAEFPEDAITRKLPHLRTMSSDVGLSILNWNGQLADFDIPYSLCDDRMMGYWEEKNVTPVWWPERLANGGGWREMAVIFLSRVLRARDDRLPR